ncbi:thiol-disulfide oxidoreductase DCC family protein [Synechococcus sp. O70.1]|uniref:thiol-disulfide oxidoreductase DCC family protein n=1 Tax=Synechococcus sp. O70.1 TaxID=2964535 RepID=UPI0039C4DD2C
MPYMVIYDGLCNLCATGVQLLEQLDRGRQFCYAPMQDASTLAQWGIPPEQVELGMILIDLEHPERRWQGSAAIEQIAALLPGGELWLAFYRNFPGLKLLGDRGYEQIRDHRYEWFGRRNTPYLCALLAAGHRDPQQKVNACALQVLHDHRRCAFLSALWVYLRLDSRFAFEFPWGELGSSC